ncbi:hypothetical protein JTE90_006226 [Oedothorax gibbosus]|uniref:G-protein coupled receptors family 1 profile domain-containing protein n=1 Tax=Oedothorax gibbosus TaxID=931172 RepID=A0AAV6VW48_9ARAC|nr:hypothetical protein JTE90_006226 [Oedothorax gibbosus]
MAHINDSLCYEILLLDHSAEMTNFSLTIMDSSVNITKEQSYFKTFNSQDYIKIIAYVIVIVGGLLGNISVILTVALNRSMRTTINYYVANLAVADALICMICMGAHLLMTLTRPVYALGGFMCKFNPFMQMTCLTSSVLTLSAISCDRFMAIMFPLHVRITKQRTSIVMQVVWILSIIVSIPFLLVKKHEVYEFQDFVQPVCTERWPMDSYYDEKAGHCDSVEKYRSTYYLMVSITLYFLPIFIMITAYSLILWKLWISEVPGERHAANINVQYRARKKVIKMVLVVLIAFILCWTPMQSVILSSAFGAANTINSYWYEDFTFFSYYIAYANSFMNPIIYGGFNKTFREGFCIVLRCGFRRERFGRPPRSRMTFTTGVTSSPSRYASRTINGANKTASQKSNNIEMKPFQPHKDVEVAPSLKDTCVSILDEKELL